MKNYSIETWFRSLEDLRYGVPKIEILTKYGITDERILLRWKGDFENRVYTEAVFRFDKIAVCEQGNRQILAQIRKIGAVNFSPLWCGGGQDPNFWKRASSFIYKFWSGLHSLKLSGTALRMNIVPVTCFPCILLQQLPIVK